MSLAIFIYQIFKIEMMKHFQSALLEKFHFLAKTKISFFLYQSLIPLCFCLSLLCFLLAFLSPQLLFWDLASWNLSRCLPVKKKMIKMNLTTMNKIWQVFCLHRHFSTHQTFKWSRVKQAMLTGKVTDSTITWAEIYDPPLSTKILSETHGIVSITWSDLPITFPLNPRPTLLTHLSESIWSNDASPIHQWPAFSFLSSLVKN